MVLLVKSRGVTPVSWPNSHHWPLSIMAPNNPHTLDWLYDYLSSPPVAVVLWHPGGCCTLVVVEERPPFSVLETKSQTRSYNHTSDVVVQLKDFSHTSVLRMTNGRKKEIVTDVPKW